MKELRKLNFGELIKVGFPDIDNYTFNEYRRNGYEHSPIDGYCISCEEKGVNAAKDNEEYRLTNISHGAHSSDFFLALKDKIDTSDWHQEPIIFVYETPSLDYGIYREVPYENYNKCPSRDWYWIHDDQDAISYPERFRGGEYGGFVLSAILTFKLQNVYITNLVKCGLNDKNGRFKGLSFFKGECVENCYRQFLEKEIHILNPSIIFAVGSAVEEWVKWFVKEAVFVQQLPHPYGRRRGFRDEHYKALYFWLIVRALHKVGIIRTDGGSQLAKRFLDQYDSYKA